MSIQKRSGRYVVRWHEGGRHRSRTFLVKQDAQAFDLDNRRRIQLGPLAATVLQSKMTLAEFVEGEWWPRYAVPNLKASTQRRYLETWGSHLLDRLGGFELRSISPLLVEDFRAQLDRAGVSLGEQRRAMMLLQGILHRAVVRGLLPLNAAQLAQKPRQKPAVRPEPLSPVVVERIRSLLDWRDATLVSVLAYAGLRPGEATGLRWRDVGSGVLHVHASKTDRPRAVRLLSPLAGDLAEWRMISGRPADGALVFPRPDGGEWRRGDWNNWRNRVWLGRGRDEKGRVVLEGAAPRAGVSGDMRIYRLRGSYVSLLLAEGRPLIYVAEQAGHSVAVLARHYAGVMAELAEQPTVAEAAIRQARSDSSLRKSCSKGLGA